MLFAVLVLSLMYRTPESMGEEMVSSIMEGGVAESGLDVGTGSKTRKAACCGTTSVAVRGDGSGVELWAMSSTGRVVEGSGAVLTLAMMGGPEESSEGIRPESAEGETVTAGDEGGLSCTEGAGESARVV